MTRSLVDKAEALRELHRRGEAVLVPNAWDAASARVLASAGFRTIATTSAGVAWASGRADGQQLSLEEAVQLTERIAGSVEVPVSVDAEGGYLGASVDIEDTIRRLIAAGAAGVNLEDGNFGGGPEPLVDPESHAETISRARRASEEAGVRLFINGRTDVYFRRVGREEERLEEAKRRLQRYALAGSDCVFAPGVSDPKEIAALVEAVDVPLNVMRVRGLPSPGELRDLGVARVTFGADLLFASLAALSRISDALRREDFSELEREGLPPREVVGLLVGGKPAPAAAASVDPAK